MGEDRLHAAMDLWNNTALQTGRSPVQLRNKTIHASAVAMGTFECQACAFVGRAAAALAIAFLTAHQRIDSIQSRV